MTFAQRSFDLAPLRAALVVQKDGARAQTHIAQFAAQAAVDHAPFEVALAALGGQVRQHWWIVDACLVIAPPQVTQQQLRALPGVARVDPDLLVAATGVRPLDTFNHGAAFNHSVGFDGSPTQGEILAILDSGIDIVAGTGRPHRTFFPGGDAANATGPGLAGSRVAFNVQLGLLPADDQHGHGTSVAAVAAGDAWTAAGLGRGHAKGATIGSYGIGDQIQPNGGIFAFYSTMTSAWQLLLADRATQNIVVANNSFFGEQDPLHPVQQALDTTAWVGDVLVCVSAGNSGPAAFTGGQSCVNGLAVAAVQEDTHTVASFSSRGPVVGDSQRTWPDLSAVVWGRTPLLDDETTAGLFGGTSSAAPRVAGAAMTIRVAQPSLRADETKAILLASAADVDAANPGLTANDFGVGISRDDRALATANDSNRHGRLTAFAASPAVTWTVPVVPGAPHRGAIAWMRTVMGSTAWSNLDLVVRDPATGTVLDSSASPRNLYEVVRFVGPAGGQVEFVASPTFIGTGVQEFAFAVSSDPLLPERGTFEIHGAGCEGPTPNADPECGVGANMQADPASLAPFFFSSQWENVISLVAPTGGMTLTGFELLARNSGESVRPAVVYRDAGNGTPQLTPVATGTIRLDSIARWYRADLQTAVPLASGERFWVGLQGWDKTFVALDAPGAPDVVTVFSRDRRAGTASWGGTYNERIGVRTLCQGPLVGDVPLHHLSRAPRVGETIDLCVARLAPGATVGAAIGFSDTLWAGGLLPVDLSILGGTGCALRVEPALTASAVADPQGVASITLGIHSNPAMLGWIVFSQFVVLDPASPRMVTVSNSGRWRIGSR